MGPGPSKHKYLRGLRYLFERVRVKRTPEIFFHVGPDGESGVACAFVARPAVVEEMTG